MFEVKPFLVSCKKGDVFFSEHAVRQFVARWKKHFPRTPLQDYEEKIIELFEAASEENVDPVIRVKRLISNQFRPANYFYHKGSLHG